MVVSSMGAVSPLVYESVYSGTEGGLVGDLLMFDHAEKGLLLNGALHWLTN